MVGHKLTTEIILKDALQDGASLDHTAGVLTRREVRSEKNRDDLLNTLRADGSPTALEIARQIEESLGLGQDDIFSLGTTVSLITKITK